MRYHGKTLCCFTMVLNLVRLIYHSLTICLTILPDQSTVHRPSIGWRAALVVAVEFFHPAFSIVAVSRIYIPVGELVPV